MRVIGLDIGSRTVKRVTVDGGEVIEHRVVPNNHGPLTVCDELLAGQRADRVVATGYGRHLFAAHRGAETLTEIRALALGARQVRPGECLPRRAEKDPVPVHSSVAWRAQGNLVGNPPGIGTGTWRLQEPDPSVTGTQEPPSRHQVAPECAEPGRRKECDGAVGPRSLRRLSAGKTETVEPIQDPAAELRGAASLPAGPAGDGPRGTAHRLARHLGRRLLEVLPDLLPARHLSGPLAGEIQQTVQLAPRLRRGQPSDAGQDEGTPTFPRRRIRLAEGVEGCQGLPAEQIDVVAVEPRRRAQARRRQGQLLSGPLLVVRLQ